MYFSHPSPYEMGGSPDIEVEDAALEASGIPPHRGSELGLIPLEGADPIDVDRLLDVAGLSIAGSAARVNLSEDLSDGLSQIVIGGRASRFEQAFGVKLGISSRSL